MPSCFRTAKIESFVAGDAPVQMQQFRSSQPQFLAPNAVQAEVRTPDQQYRQSNQSNGGPTKKRKVGGGKDLSEMVGGEFVKNRSGTRLCAAYQTGACTNGSANNRCSADRNTVHQCAKCLGAGHGRYRCDNGQASQRRKIGGKGNGGRATGGKGKNRW